MVVGAFRGWVRIVRGTRRSRASQLIRGVGRTLTRRQIGPRGRMSKRGDFWEQLQQDENGDVLWPEDSEARAALAKDILGARVVGAVEGVLEEELEVADGKPPRPGRDDYQEEAARRELFASMSDAQRAAVRGLLKRACFGTLYWILVKLKNYPGASVDITMYPWLPGGGSLPSIGLNETELYFWYFDWVKKFTDHGDK